MAGRVIGVGPDVAGAVGHLRHETLRVVGQRELLGRLGRIGRVGIGQRDELVLAVVTQGDAVAVGVLLVIQEAVGQEDVLRAGGVGERVDAAGLVSEPYSPSMSQKTAVGLDGEIAEGRRRN